VETFPQFPEQQRGAPAHCVGLLAASQQTEFELRQPPPPPPLPAIIFLISSLLITFLILFRFNFCVFIFLDLNRSCRYHAPGIQAACITKVHASLLCKVFLMA
jgi:hypothetical protein